MSELLENYKTFWKRVKPLAQEQGITGFRIQFAGSCDNGSIEEIDMIKGGKRKRKSKKEMESDESSETDEFGNKMRPHPWEHSDETFVNIEDDTGSLGAALVVPNVPHKKETFEGGWKIEEVVGDLTLSEVVKTIGYEVVNRWFPGWEINDGAQGTLYFYPTYIEMDFMEFYDDENSRGHKCYSETIKFQDFDFDYDVGYRGKYLDELKDDDDEEINEDDE
jgi:hypothetical protein